MNITYLVFSENANKSSSFEASRRHHMINPLSSRFFMSTFSTMTKLLLVIVKGDQISGHESTVETKE